jgi:hypothetical protein
VTLSFLTDENIPRRLVEALKADGHDVLWVAEAAPGSPDGVLLGRAVAVALSQLMPLGRSRSDFAEINVTEGMSTLTNTFGTKLTSMEISVLASMSAATWAENGR